MRSVERGLIHGLELLLYWTMTAMFLILAPIVVVLIAIVGAVRIVVDDWKQRDNWE